MFGGSGVGWARQAFSAVKKALPGRSGRSIDYPKYKPQRIIDVDLVPRRRSARGRRRASARTGDQLAMSWAIVLVFGVAAAMLLASLG